MAMNPVCFTKYRCKYGKMTIINYRPHGKSFQEHDTLNGSMHRKTHAVNLSSPFWFSASSSFCIYFDSIMLILSSEVFGKKPACQCSLMDHYFKLLLLNTSPIKQITSHVAI